MTAHSEADNWLRSEVRSAASILALTCLVFAALTGGFVVLAIGSARNWPAALMFGPIAMVFVWGLARSARWAFDPYSFPDFRRVSARRPVRAIADQIASDVASGERVGHLRLGREYYVYRRPLGINMALGHLGDIRKVERIYRPGLGPVVRLTLPAKRPQLLPARTSAERDAMADALERSVHARREMKGATASVRER